MIMVLKRVEFHSFLVNIGRFAWLWSWKCGICTVLSNMLAIFAQYVVLEDLKMHGSIVYYDILTWLWSWKTWNFTGLLQFYWYTVMSWSCNGSF